MYLRPVFLQRDHAKVAGLIRANPFAQVVSAGPRGLEASHLPLSYHAAGKGFELSGHFAAGNPQCDVIGSQTEVLAIFAGPHAYISPGWYECGPAVPTWDFAAVHVYGRLQPVADAADVAADVAVLGAGDPADFDVMALAAEYRAQMFGGIRAFRLRPARMETQWKLSQNRSPADRRRVMAALRAQGDAVAEQVADMIGQTLPATEDMP